MKILIVTANFAAASVQPWLLDDLAAEFAKQGHSVDVLVHSPTAPRPRGIQTERTESVRVCSVGVTRPVQGALRKLGSYLATGVRLHTSGLDFVKRQQPYDLCVYTSIGAFSYGFPSRIRRTGLAKKLLFVMWDYFPIHQVEIGRIRRSPLVRALKAIEWAAIKRADVIAVMSPANERFMRTYHPRVAAPIIHVPPWSAAPKPSTEGVNQRDTFTVIFGGQLVPGRGVATLLDAASALQASGVAAEILIAGDGVERPNFEQRAKELRLHNVTFLGMLAREKYRELLTTTHAGIAITVPGVTPPSFPSKIVEYCANRLPVIACLEDSSDAGDYLEQHRAGISVPAGDALRLAAAISMLEAEHRDGSLPLRADAAQRLFDSQLSAERAAERMIEALRTNSDEPRLTT